MLALCEVGSLVSPWSAPVRSAKIICGSCINSEHAELAGVFDPDPARAADAAAAYGCPVFRKSRRTGAKCRRRHHRVAHRHPCRNRLPPDGARPRRDGGKTHRPRCRRRRAAWSKPPSATEKSCKSAIWNDSIPPSSRSNRPYAASLLRNSPHERIQPALSRRRCGPGPDDSRYRHRSVAHRQKTGGNSRRRQSRFCLPKWISPTSACNFPADASPTSLPAASPPSASANSACSSRTSTFRLITAARTPCDST